MRQHKSRDHINKLGFAYYMHQRKINMATQNRAFCRELFYDEFHYGIIY